jgi:MYXO-CTERM domain-containing protein
MDAGPVDAGVVTDAGTVTDAGHSSSTDGGADGGVPSSSSGCSSATSSDSPLWMMALGLVGLYRRRQRRA